jgi:hypothetical protein
VAPPPLQVPVRGWPAGVLLRMSLGPGLFTLEGGSLNQKKGTSNRPFGRVSVAEAKTNRKGQDREKGWAVAVRVLVAIAGRGTELSDVLRAASAGRVETGCPQRRGDGRPRTRPALN